MEKIGSLVRKLFLILLLTVMLLEGVLQVGGYFLGGDAVRAKTRWLTGNIRVLALGDSNTYGLYLEKHEAWPAQLEAAWNIKHSDQSIEVINLGYPGTNSFRLLANLPDLIETFRPDVVLIMIGFNDFWTPVEEIAETEPNVFKRLLLKSRLYKLYFIAQRKAYFDEHLDRGKRNDKESAGLDPKNLSAEDIAFLTQETGKDFPTLIKLVQSGDTKSEAAQQLMIAVDKLQKKKLAQQQAAGEINIIRYEDDAFYLGIIEGEPARNSKQLENNLKKMFSSLESNDVETVLINYPTKFGYYPAANKKIEKVAEETGVNFIDINNVLPKNCQRRPETCPDLLFYDAHATKKGNGVIAEKIGQSLSIIMQ